jgi:16S rRNA processing protein RimM
MFQDPEPRYLVVGQIVGAHGVRGEVKVAILTDDPHRFGRLERVYVGEGEEEPAPWPLEGYRLHAGHALLKFEGCNDRDTAKSLQGTLVQVPLAAAIPLQDGEYFEHQILGLGVWSVEGEHLGEIAEIIYTGANDVYVIHSPGPEPRDILIPALEDVVLEIDLEARRMTAALPEGL